MSSMSWAAMIKYCRLGGLNNMTSLSHNSGEQKVQDEDPVGSASGVCSPPGLQEAAFCILHMVK